MLFFISFLSPQPFNYVSTDFCFSLEEEGSEERSKRGEDAWNTQNSLEQLGDGQMRKKPAVISQNAVNICFLTVTPQGFGLGSKAF